MVHLQVFIFMTTFRFCFFRLLLRLLSSAVSPLFGAKSVFWDGSIYLPIYLIYFLYVGRESGKGNKKTIKKNKNKHSEVPISEKLKS